MNFNPNMANREVANLVFLDYKTKVPVLNCDYANVTTTGLSANRVYAKGGWGAPNRVGFDGERAGTLQIDTQITPMKLYGILSGSGLLESAKYLKREVLLSATQEITLSETPILGSVNVFKVDDDCGTPLEITVTGSTAAITESAFVDGEVVAYYIVEKATGAQTVKFTSSIFPKAFEVHGELPYKTEDEEIVACKLVYYKAQPQANISMAFSNTGDPTTLSITCDLYENNEHDIYSMSIIED